VDRPRTQVIGATAQGRRIVAPIAGGSFEGPRLKGEVLAGGADWVIARRDGAMAIDARVTLKTDDGALIYCAYEGLFRAAPETMARFAKGELPAEGEYALQVIMRFEAGAEAYRWLGDTLAVAVGRHTATGPVYTVHGIVSPDFEAS
jgi:hypothetical protein